MGRDVSRPLRPSRHIEAILSLEPSSQVEEGASGGASDSDLQAEELSAADPIAVRKPSHENAAVQSGGRPAPGRQVELTMCDFCMDSEAVWLYPAGSGDRWPHSWRACSTCFLLIEFEEREMLLQRAREHSAMPPRLVAAAHLLFWEHRSGPAKRIEGD